MNLLIPESLDDLRPKDVARVKGTEGGKQSLRTLDAHSDSVGTYSVGICLFFLLGMSCKTFKKRGLYLS